jgi:putative transposase
MELVFAQYGLPDIIRSDNGPPFSTTARAGVSALALWWLRLGIHPERIQPGKPGQNGRHERMHRTLKDSTASPPRATLLLQQAAFDAFRQQFNHVRPHESLGQKRPANFYRPSPKKLPNVLPAFTYPKSWEVRSVKRNGYIVWNGTFYFLSEVLNKQRVGLERVDDRWAKIYIGRLLIACVDDLNKRIVTLDKVTKK